MPSTSFQLELADLSPRSPPPSRRGKFKMFIGKIGPADEKCRPLKMRPLLDHRGEMESKKSVSERHQDRD